METFPVSVPTYPPTEQAEYLRTWRRERNLSIRGLADLLGLSAVQVGDLHRGKRSVHPNDWPGVVAALAVWGPP